MARRLRYAVFRSRSAAPRPCGCPSLLEKKARHEQASIDVLLRCEAIYITSLHFCSRVSLTITISRYPFVESILTNFPPVNLIGTRSSTAGGELRERTLPASSSLVAFQSTAGERRGVTCSSISSPRIASTRY